jgi:hypothetical protein
VQAVASIGPAVGSIQDNNSAARNLRRRARLPAVTGIRNDGAGPSFDRQPRKAAASEVSISAFIVSFLQNTLTKLLEFDTHNKG